MTSDKLKLRTKKFSLRIINLIQHLPGNKVSNVIGNQLLRSATSIGTNYRAACRSRSKVEFISKIRVVEEEVDESVYWIELINDSQIFEEEKVSSLLKEANELTAIFTSIGKTTKMNLRNSKSQFPNPKLETSSKSEIPNSKSQRC